MVYESSGGGSVSKRYRGTPKEEAQNLAAAKVLADKKGWKIDLLENKGVGKSCDARINGENWEIKTNYTPTKNSIDTLLRSAKGQSVNIILHIQSGIKLKDAVSATKNRMNRSLWIENVLIISKGNKLVNLRRK